jgi:hypothetical protein
MDIFGPGVNSRINRKSGKCSRYSPYEIRPIYVIGLKESSFLSIDLLESTRSTIIIADPVAAPKYPNFPIQGLRQVMEYINITNPTSAMGVTRKLQ